MNMGIHVSSLFTAFSEYTPTSAVAGSYGRFIPHFLRNLRTVVHNGYISYIPTNSVGGGPFSPPPLLHLLLVGFLMMAILTGVRRSLTALVCISLLISDVGHICTCLLSARFWIGCLFFAVEFWVLYTFLDIGSLPDMISKYCLPLSLFAVSFCWWFLLLCRSFLVWCSPAYLFLLLLLLVSDLKKSVPRPLSGSLQPVFSSRSFKVPGLMLKIELFWVNLSLTEFKIFLILSID